MTLMLWILTMFFNTDRFLEDSLGVNFQLKEMECVGSKAGVDFHAVLVDSKDGWAGDE